MIYYLSGRVRRSLRILVLAVFAFHFLAITVIVIAVAFPNIFKRYTKYSPDLAGQIPHEAVLFKSRRGNVLHGWFFANPASRRVIVLCHGRSYNKTHEMPYVNDFLKHYNVLIFDFTGHGENPYVPTSIGYHESYDVLGAVDWLDSRGFREIVIMGHSMGGAAAIKAIAEYGGGPVRFKAVITEGVFARLDDLLLRQIRRFYVPATVWRPAFWISERIAGYKISENVPERFMRQVRCPALIMQADRDSLASSDSAQRLGMTAAGSREVVTFSGRHDVPSTEVSANALRFLLGR